MLGNIKIAGSGRVEKPEATETVKVLDLVTPESLFENPDENQFFQMLHEYLPDGLFLHVKVQISDFAAQKDGALQSYRLWQWRRYRKTPYMDYVVADSEGRPLIAIILFENGYYADSDIEKLVSVTSKITPVPLYHLERGQNYWFHINRILALLRPENTDA